jgi:membrane dipeptidase
MAPTAAQIHEESVIVNGLAQSGNLPLAYDAMIDGGITASNLTVAANEDFPAAVKRFEYMLRTMEQHAQADRLTLIENAGDIRAAKAAGLTGVIMGFQNADPIEDDLEYLHVFRRLGLRIVQLTYQRRNLLGDGSSEPADGGLSMFGRQVVEACNELGILVDVSHCGHQTSLDAVEASSAPIVISHANLYSINPVFRNKKDEVIKAVAERGGLMGITSVSRLLSARGNEEGADLSQVLDQIEAVIELAGIDHVGVGLDISEGMTQEEFEVRQATFLAKFPELRMGGTFPLEHYFARGISSAAEFPNITAGLVERGYTTGEVKQIVGGNFMRVFDEAFAPN